METVRKEVPVSSLVFDPDNPRGHNDANIRAIREGLSTWGQLETLLVQKGTNIVIAGNGRLQVMRELGWKKVAVEFLECGEEERKLLSIAMNRTGELAHWNVDQLKETLQDLSGVDALTRSLAELGDMNSLLGFTAKDLELPAPGKADIGAGSAVPAAPKKPKTKLGDVWVLGKHLLKCCDVTEDDGEWMDCSGRGFGFTSPPYNVGNSSIISNTNLEGKYLGDSDDMPDEDYLALLDGSTQFLLDHCELACINLQQLANNKRVIIDWLYGWKDNFADRAIWKKANSAPAMAENVMNSSFEDLFLFASKSKPSRALPLSNFRGNVLNVYEGRNAGADNENSDVHGATMPLGLAHFCIDAFGDLADYVVDPFGGTGTTLIVAEKLNKRSMLLEISPIYCDVIVQRWRDYTGGKPKLQ